jgi:putative ABC transport system substrate-binding protein
MRRRQFITLAGGAAIAWPLAGWAQPTTGVYRIGLLGGSPPDHPSGRLWDDFFQGLRELGYDEGRNILVEARWYGEQTASLPSLAAELVRAKVDIIVAGAAPAPEDAQRATSTIPIVMASHPDPVGSGLVVSLARPGKNVTGLSNLASELVSKQLQLLKEIVPGISRVAVLWNPTISSQALNLREADVAARSLKIQLQVLEVRSPRDFTKAFAAMTKERVAGVIAFGGSMFYAERARITELAAQSRLPAIYVVREYVESGGLVAYGTSLRESWRRAATYVDKILKGAKPGDLPVEQPTKFELVINLKTAKALGLEVPPSLLARADEVIE